MLSKKEVHSLLKALIWKYGLDNMSLFCSFIFFHMFCLAINTEDMKYVTTELRSLGLGLGLKVCECLSTNCNMLWKLYVIYVMGLYYMHVLVYCKQRWWGTGSASLFLSVAQQKHYPWLAAALPSASRMRLQPEDRELLESLPLFRFTSPNQKKKQKMINFPTL